MPLVPTTTVIKIFIFTKKKLSTITVTVPESCGPNNMIMLSKLFPFLFSTSKGLELSEIGLLSSYKRILSLSQRLAHFLTSSSLVT